MSSSEAFNRSGLSRFINSSAGRIFRMLAGAGFPVIGYLFRDHTLGMISMLWSVFPLSAGGVRHLLCQCGLGWPIVRSKDTGGTAVPHGGPKYEITVAVFG